MRPRTRRVRAHTPPGEDWRQSATSLALAAAIVFAAVSPSAADPAETKPEAVALDPDYAAAKLALERKDWREAIERFGRSALREPDNADLQNYLGYSYRNSGQLGSAFTHYKRALELNPRHRGAHEYAGEAYLIVHKLAKAEEHLTALHKICLIPCEEYADLKKKIADYRGKTGK